MLVNVDRVPAPKSREKRWLEMAASQMELIEKLQAENAHLRDRLGYDKQPEQPMYLGRAGSGTQNCPRAETPQETIDYLFTFHDDPDKAPHFVEIRESAKQFALVVIRHASAGSADQRTAIEHIRQAVMFANASVALNGRCF